MDSFKRINLGETDDSTLLDIIRNNCYAATNIRSELSVRGNVGNFSSTLSRDVPKFESCVSRDDELLRCSFEFVNNISGIPEESLDENIGFMLEFCKYSDKKKLLITSIFEVGKRINDINDFIDESAESLDSDDFESLALERSDYESLRNKLVVYLDSNYKSNKKNRRCNNE